jgi:hypothetical protein
VRAFGVGVLRIGWALAIPFVLAATRSAAGQDFDPRGRHRDAPTPAHGAGATRAPAGGRGDEAHGGPPQLIARYTRVVLSQPGVSFPLQRLVQLYRDRDGKIATLIADFEARAAQSGADQYAATVALAGLYKIDGRTEDAVSAYERAISIKGDDAAAILALTRLPARATSARCRCRPRRRTRSRPSGRS